MRPKFIIPIHFRVNRYRLLGLLLLVGAGVWFAVAHHQNGPQPAALVDEFCFQHDHVLGTSLDLVVVVADAKAATACEKAILDEIERLRIIFSTFDPQSEISRLNATSSPLLASPEIIDVLRAYDVMQQRSQGAFNGQLGQLVSIWKAAEQAGVEPESAALDEIVRQISQPGWKIDETHNTVTRLTNQPLNLNAIAKGYIIQKAMAAARRAVPSLNGLLINLGGDISVWGQDGAARNSWTIGVQDPFHSAENAPPLAVLQVQNAAVATSGSYERYVTINGKKHSHIFDPRTGRPATGVASATVIAADNVTANALATTLCVLAPEDGLRLVAETPGAECLLVTDDGEQVRSAGMKALEAVVLGQQPPTQAEQGVAAVPNPWPAGNEVSITVTLPNIGGGKGYRRPYVAVWIESADSKAIRTLAVWGNSPKYLKDLTSWWAVAKNDAELVRAVTRATRPPGKYSLVWDGKDNKGQVMPQGTYTIRVEVHREHGKHVMQTGKIECRADPASVTLAKNAETETTVVEFGKKK